MSNMYILSNFGSVGVHEWAKTFIRLLFEFSGVLGCEN